MGDEHAVGKLVERSHLNAAKQQDPADKAGDPPARDGAALSRQRARALEVEQQVDEDRQPGRRCLAEVQDVSGDRQRSPQPEPYCGGGAPAARAA